MTPAPKRLRIDGETVQVNQKKSLGTLKEGHPVGGLYQDRKIQLSPVGMTRMGLRSNLFHELGHYFLERDGVRLTRAQEEAVAGAFSWIAYLLRENPDLVAWVTEEWD